MSSANARGPLWEDGIYRVDHDDDADDPHDAATRVGEFDQESVQAMMGLAAANVRTTSSIPPRRPIPREETMLMPSAPPRHAPDAAPVSGVVTKSIAPLPSFAPPRDVQIRIAPDAPQAMGFAATIPASWTPAPLVPERTRSSRALVFLAITISLLAVAVTVAVHFLRG